MEAFKWEHRRLFNDLLFDEIIQDFRDVNIKSILDIGCGDGYLLYRFSKSFSHPIYLYCAEKKTTFKFNSNHNTSKIQSIKLDNYLKYADFFDVIILIDVIYLMDKHTLQNTLDRIKVMLKAQGVCYIMLGIYKESRGVSIFAEELKSLKHNYKVTIYSLDELIFLFRRNFKVYLKRLEFNKLFGIMPAKDTNLKRFLDYLYEDKILIKLSKNTSGEKLSWECP